MGAAACCAHRARLCRDVGLFLGSQLEGLLQQAHSILGNASRLASLAPTSPPLLTLCGQAWELGNSRDCSCAPAIVVRGAFLLASRDTCRSNFRVVPVANFFTPTGQ